MSDLDDDKLASFAGWPEHKLRGALRTALKDAKEGVLIFVDGLDEYEGSIIQLIEFLKSLATSNDIQVSSTKVCLSSRPEPIPSQLLQHLPNLNISDHNRKGIQSYCLLTLEGFEPVVREGLYVSELSYLVATRAEGVFLWARFALEQLLLGHFSGETFREISARLDSIPGDIEDVYDRMLGRMEPLAKKECMIMLQLVCFAQDRLSWQELCVATEIAMEKEVFLTKYICGDVYSTQNILEKRSIFAKRLRAKAAGLLEFDVGANSPFSLHNTSHCPKLIHKSVQTYLDHKGWRILGGLEEDSCVVLQSMYIKTCTRYLHGFLRQYKLEKASLKIWARKLRLRASNGSNWMLNLNQESTEPFGQKFPLLTYAAGHVFLHAELLEGHGVSSYTLLQEFLTEEFFYLHYLCRESQSACGICLKLPEYLALDEEFDATCIAFLHRLGLYCKNDVDIRFPAPGQKFWNRALSFAIMSYRSQEGSASHEAVVSLALRNVATVEQHHIEKGLRNGHFDMGNPIPTLPLVLQHESVKDLALTYNLDLALTDNPIDYRRPIKILYYFVRTLFTRGRTEEWLRIFIEVANRRGEDVRQPCGPKGNVVEMLVKHGAYPRRKEKLYCLKAYYESMSWPFDYDSDEIED